jgi:diadenosine tetraphosphate (Ap4A) HIT family hydrolase
MTSPACPACGGQWPAPEQRIADCGSTIAYLHDDQFFAGWTFLVLKRHATELWQLEAVERAQLIEEVARVARAVSTAFGAEPRRLGPAEMAERIALIRSHLGA